MQKPPPNMQFLPAENAVLRAWLKKSQPCRWAKSSSRLRGIALSGHGTEEDVERARSAGFVARLIKPVRIVQLRKALDALR